MTALAQNPRNARSGYDDVQELADSLREYGVLQPLGVIRYEVFLGRYPDLERNIGSAHWVVLQGNRRLAAARKAKIEDVPVVAHERVGREDVFDESSLVENVHRKDLPPLQEAALLRELLDKHGSQRKLASKLKKSQSYISQRLSLFDLVPALQEEVARGEIGFAAARNLAGIAQEHQEEAYEAGPPYHAPNHTTDYGVINDESTESHHLHTIAAAGETAQRGSSHSPNAPEGTRSEDSAATRKRRMKFPIPATLAPQIRTEYTQEQRTELARLLLE